MEQLVNLIHICMETGHPVVLWSTDTSSFGEEEVVHSDPYQVVICVTDESEWGSKIKNLFNFTSEKSANAAMRFIVA